MRLQDAWPLYHPTDEYFSMTSTHTFYPIKNRYNLASLVKEYWPWAEVIHLNNDLALHRAIQAAEQEGQVPCHSPSRHDVPNSPAVPPGCSQALPGYSDHQHSGSSCTCT